MPESTLKKVYANIGFYFMKKADATGFVFSHTFRFLPKGNEQTSIF